MVMTNTDRIMWFMDIRTSFWILIVVGDFMKRFWISCWERTYKPRLSMILKYILQSSQPHCWKSFCLLLLTGTRESFWQVLLNVPCFQPYRMYSPTTQHVQTTYMLFVNGKQNVCPLDRKSRVNIPWKYFGFGSYVHSPSIWWYNTVYELENADSGTHPIHWTTFPIWDWTMYLCWPFHYSHWLHASCHDMLWI